MKNEIDLGFSAPVSHSGDKSLIASTEARAVAEVQASYIIAKKFPRNQHEAYSNIIQACKRPFLAETAMYAYPRGGQLVKGPSIRLAEVLAQCWGNIDCGIREISQGDGVSVAEAYAVDLETNVRIVKVFHVAHSRDTKQGKKRLNDARDIYELVANNGARRLRACILGIIPGDVIDAAVEECGKTLESSEVPMADRIRKMLSAFDEVGVKLTHIEKRLGHKIDAIIPAELVTLQGIYKSIRDGMADRSQFFDISSDSLKLKAKEELGEIMETLRNEPRPEQNNDTDELQAS